MSDAQALEQPADLSRLPRAGFWRRLAGALIDAIIVTVPIQILVVVLFAASHGAVQTSSGIALNFCNNNVPMTAVPRDLVPPPPSGSNFASTCRSTFFGLETARWLTVGRFTRDGHVTRKIHRTYRLDTENKVTDAYVLDWVAVLALFIYLIACERRWGATVGKRQLRIRVIDVDNPNRIGVPLRKAAMRDLFMWSGLFPVIAVVLIALVASHGDLEATMETMVEGSFVSSFIASSVAGLLIFLWIFIQIARKRDPIYDRIARTAVVRTAP